MYPPIFEVVSSNADVITNLGSNPCRFYLFGEAPQNVTKPYAVWQEISGLPENYLGQVPDVDTWSIQVDVYGTSAQQVRDVAQAIRDAIEPVAHVTNFSGGSRDPDTQNYRYTLSVDWIDNRADDST